MANSHASLAQGQQVAISRTRANIAYGGGLRVSSAALYAEALALPQGRGNEHGGGRGQGGGNEHGRGNKRGGPPGRGHNRRGVRVGFSSREQYLIRRYFRNGGSNLPPGLAKRGGNLPPGLERHLEKYGTLPPGLQKRLDPFPPALARELPPLPQDCGCRRVILGDRALIINTANRILDMFLYR
jgi:hypothetical protein